MSSRPKDEKFVQEKTTSQYFMVFPTCQVGLGSGQNTYQCFLQSVVTSTVLPNLRQRRVTLRTMKYPLMAMILCCNDPGDAVPGDRSTVSRSQIRPRYPQIAMKNGSTYSHSFLIIVVVKKFLLKQKHTSHQNTVFPVESHQVFETLTLIKKEFGGDLEFTLMQVRRE